jgi:hypothetical protein
LGKKVEEINEDEESKFYENMAMDYASFMGVESPKYNK